MGTDYTFGLGNGLNVRAEQLVFAFGETAAEMEIASTLTAGTISYPVGMFSTVSTVLYYDWTNQSLFSFLSVQHQFSKLTLNLMGYWNPNHTQIIQQTEGANPFGGKGIQVLLVINH